MEGCGWLAGTLRHLLHASPSASPDLVKRPGSGSKLPEFKSQLCCLLIAMTLGKLVNVMVPQFPNLEIGDNYSINLMGLL